MKFLVLSFEFFVKKVGTIGIFLKTKNVKLKTNHGFVLVEALVAAAILSLVLASGIGAFLLSVRASLENGAEMQSAFLADEGLEAVRVLRDSGWGGNIASHASGSVLYLAFETGAWHATSTNLYVDNTFERRVTFSDVYRDGNQDIVTSGGTLDDNTKKVTVSVSWLASGGTTTRSLSMYLTNLFNN